MNELDELKQKMREAIERSAGYVNRAFLPKHMTLRGRLRLWIMRATTDIGELHRIIVNQSHDLTLLSQRMARVFAELEGQMADKADAERAYEVANQKLFEEKNQNNDLANKYSDLCERYTALSAENAGLVERIDKVVNASLIADAERLKANDAFKDLSERIIDFLVMNGVNAEEAGQLQLAKMKITGRSTAEIEPFDISDIRQMLQVDDNHRANAVKFRQLKQRVRTYLDAVQEAFGELDQIAGKNRIGKPEFEKIMQRTAQIRAAAGMASPGSRFKGAQNDG